MMRSCFNRFYIAIFVGVVALTLAVSGNGIAEDFQ